MTACPDKPECPYRVVISEYLIDEIRFAESASSAAAEVAEDHELDALLDPLVAVVAEVPAGPSARYLIRAFPVLMYEADLEPRDDADGRSASIESDPLGALPRPSDDTPSGGR